MANGFPDEMSLPQTEFELDVQMPDDPLAMFADDGMVDIGEEQEEPVLDPNFHDNILDEIDPDVLAAAIDDLANGIERDRESRSEYDQDLNVGIKELGFDRQDTTGQPFPGASTVKAPMIAKAALRYQAQAKKELFPQSGAARAITYVDNEEIEDIRIRAEQYFNYQLSYGIPGYAEEMDKTLMMLSLYGSVFRKVYFDGSTVKVDMIPVMDFLVPWSTKDLDSAPRKTQVLRLHKHEIESNFRSGFWKKADLQSPDESDMLQDRPEVRQTLDRIVGLSDPGTGEDDRYVIYETHAYLQLEDDDDLKPYIVTFDAKNKTPLAVVRNWNEDDDQLKPRQFFVHYRFLPWNGFYGIGFIQLLGGLQRAASGSLRALLDAAMQQNMSGGLINAKAITSGQQGNNEFILSPNQWTKINVPVDGRNSDIRNYILPFAQLGQPSAVLQTLLTWLMDQGDQFGSINITEMMGADKQAPVGTILAMIEQQGIIFSSIHERQHRALRREFVLIQDCNYKYLGGDNGAETVATAKGSLSVDRADFGPEISIVPAADPEVFSAAQRVAQVQAAVQMAQQAQSNGVEVDMRTAYVQFATAIGMREIDKIFPEPKEQTPPPPMDPVSEFQAILKGQPVIAHKTQNHIAHIQYLTTIRKDPFYAPLIGDKAPALEALIADHTGMQAVVEAETAMGIPLPTPEQAQAMPPQLQMMISQAVAGIAQQLASTRPAAEGGADLSNVAMLEVERKSRQDAMNTQLRAAQLQHKAESEAENRRSRESIELAKLQQKQQEMEQDSAVVSVQTQNALRQKEVEMANRQQIDLMKLQQDSAATAAELASKERIASQKIESQELQTAATLSSREQIEAARIAAENTRSAVAMVDRKLGEKQPI